MKKRLLFCAAIMTGVAAWSVDLLTEYGIPASKGVTPAEAPAKAPQRAESTASLPYFLTFDSQESLTLLTQFSNQSGKTWKWVQSCPTFNEACAKVETNAYVSGGLRSYLVLPAMTLKAGKYIFEFDAWGQSDFNPEYIAACYAKTAASIDDFTAATQIVEPTLLEGYCYNPQGGEQKKQHFSREVTIAADGTYYFAVTPAKSSGGMAVFVDNISLKEAVAAAAPGTPELSVVPDAAGALKASLTVKAPETDAEGNPLDELEGIRIYRGETLVATLAADALTTMPYTDTPPTAGNFVYQAVAFNSAGAGESARCQAYVGHAKPDMPEVFTAMRGEKRGEVEIKWSTPADIYGKTFTPSEVSYNIKVTKPENIDWFDPLLSDFHGNSHRFTVAVPEGEQAFLRFSCVAKNEYGEESATLFPAVRIPVGTPYTAPFAESFAGGALSHLFRTKMEGNFGLWGMADDELYADYGLSAQDGDNGFIVYAGMEAGDAAGLYSGIIDLAGLENPALSLYFYRQDTSNELTLWIKAGEEFEQVGQTIVMNSGDDGEWNLRVFSLEPYTGKNIEFALRAESKEPGMIAVDNINIFSRLSHDLTVALTAPQYVNLGEATTLRATVANLGARPAEGFAVEFYCNDRLLTTVEGGSGALAPETETVVEAPFIALVAGGEQTYECHARVVYDADENTDNNTSARVRLTAVKSIHPAPRNLEGSVEGTDVKLTWDEPDTDTEVILPVCEGFEQADAWAVETAAGWTFADVDRGASGFFQDFDIPAITGGKPASWFVVDGADENCRYYGLTPHTGNRCLAVLYNADGSANDDWAISPELSGAAQTVTFFARSYSASLPEEFEVLYSNGSTSPSEFKPVAGATFKGVSATWTRYAVKLPAGARRFAIRYTAKDAFCLLVDDITFSAADGEKASYTLRGYKVYRNGVAIGESTADDRSFTFGNVDLEAVNDFHVTAVYRRYGESAPSNVVTIGRSSIADVNSDNINLPEEYYNLQGVRIDRPQPGQITIVRRGSDAAKRIAR